MSKLLRFPRSLVALILSVSLANVQRAAARMLPMARNHATGVQLGQKLMLRVGTGGQRRTMEFTTAFPFLQLRRAPLESVRILLTPPLFTGAGLGPNGLEQPSALEMSYLAQSCSPSSFPVVFIPAPSGGACPSAFAPNGRSSDPHCFA